MKGATRCTARLRVFASSPVWKSRSKSEVKRQTETPLPGLVATYVYQMDRDPREFFLVVMFESKEAYVANAQDPRQHEDYLRLMTFLAAEPEWNDGEIISTQDTRLAQ